MCCLKKDQKKRESGHSGAATIQVGPIRNVIIVKGGEHTSGSISVRGVYTRTQARTQAGTQHIHARARTLSRSLPLTHSHTRAQEDQPIAVDPRGL